MLRRYENVFLIGEDLKSSVETFIDEIKRIRYVVQAAKELAKEGISIGIVDPSTLGYHH